MSRTGAWHNIDMEKIDYECPRCASPATDDFYGPCPSCREELRATLGGEKRQMVAAEYEPKVNVTANAVATRDD